jgi:hypothetical protein
MLDDNFGIQFTCSSCNRVINSCKTTVMCLCNTKYKIVIQRNYQFDLDSISETTGVSKHNIQILLDNIYYEREKDLIADIIDEKYENYRARKNQKTD